MADYLEKLLAACEAKAERVSKPIAVTVKGLGQFYVRPRLCTERDQFDEAMKDGDTDTVARGVAALVCLEDGSRPPVDARKRLADVFARLPLSDIAAIGSAADGADEGN